MGKLGITLVPTKRKMHFLCIILLAGRQTYIVWNVISDIKKQVQMKVNWGRN